VLTRRPDTIPRRNSGKARITICVRIMEGARPKITVAFNQWVRPTRSLAGWRCNRAQRNRGWGRARK
jgi:hypothetical protein